MPRRAAPAAALLLALLLPQLGGARVLLQAGGSASPRPLPARLSPARPPACLLDRPCAAAAALPSAAALTPPLPSPCSAAHADHVDAQVRMHSAGGPRPFAAAFSLPAPGGASSSGGGGNGSSSGDWEVTPHDFLRGPKLLSSEVADGEEACGAACADDPACLFWSFCAAGAGKAGCPVLAWPAPDEDAADASLPAGTCLLSGLADAATLAYTRLAGKALPWTSGVYTGGGGPAASPAPGKSPSGSKSPAPAKSPAPTGDCPVHEPPTPEWPSECC